MKVGVDIIEIERIERALERAGFRERCFTEAEREYCDSRARPPFGGIVISGLSLLALISKGFEARLQGRAG